ncbi:hypothetical protein Acsp04_44090 [Actinomadura sp. NBRC 104425]|uniref:hypothetical protein n=1 Tax=Actinomadura sp. NBRC 104425 TaxID=3032204 RepID=UPI0024A1EB4A|nr:hypothetical protein [Actinomadura sp. NBRC 104425]GLZ14174.1 hypothetical protein Acsp04_44090 [Actinomadura sp. NBRC 104425]
MSAPDRSTSATVPASAGTVGFYVSVRTGARAHAALALGPFPDRRVARLQVEPRRRHVAERCRSGGWWRFGTVRITARPGRPLPVGTNNQLLEGRVE